MTLDAPHLGTVLSRGIAPGRVLGVDDRKATARAKAVARSVTMNSGPLRRKI